MSVNAGIFQSESCVTFRVMLHKSLKTLLTNYWNKSKENSTNFQQTLEKYIAACQSITQCNSNHIKQYCKKLQNDFVNIVHFFHIVEMQYIKDIYSDNMNNKECIYSKLKFVEFMHSFLELVLTSQPQIVDFIIPDKMRYQDQIVFVEDNIRDALRTLIINGGRVRFRTIQSASQPLNPEAPPIGGIFVKEVEKSELPRALNVQDQVNSDLSRNSSQHSSQFKSQTSATSIPQTTATSIPQTTATPSTTSLPQPSSISKQETIISEKTILSDIPTKTVFQKTEQPKEEFEVKSVAELKKEEQDKSETTKGDDNTTLVEKLQKDDQQDQTDVLNVLHDEDVKHTFPLFENADREKHLSSFKVRQNERGEDEFVNADDNEDREIHLLNSDYEFRGEVCKVKNVMDEIKNKSTSPFDSVSNVIKFKKN